MSISRAKGVNSTCVHDTCLSNNQQPGRPAATDSRVFCFLPQDKGQLPRSRCLPCPPVRHSVFSQSYLENPENQNLLERSQILLKQLQTWSRRSVLLILSITDRGIGVRSHNKTGFDLTIKLFITSIT